MNNLNRSSEDPDRRSSPRHTLVLRVGLLEQEGRPASCLVKNISPAGVQVKPYGRLDHGKNVTLRVGDEVAISGTVVWARDGLAGIEFEETLGREALLRVAQKMAAHRRRGAPRMNTDIQATIRTGGRAYSGTLCDLSMQGAKLRATQSVRFGESTVIDVAGLPSLRAFVRWTDGSEFGVSFETALPMQIIAELVA